MKKERPTTKWRSTKKAIRAVHVKVRRPIAWWGQLIQRQGQIKVYQASFKSLMLCGWVSHPLFLRKLSPISGAKMGWLLSVKRMASAPSSPPPPHGCVSMSVSTTARKHLLARFPCKRYLCPTSPLMNLHRKQLIVFPKR